MVKVKNALLSFFARGKLGNITLRRSRKLDVAEKIPVVRDQKTPAQLAWRTMYQACTDLWHTLSAAEKAVWESQGTARHMTGYAWYMSQCLRPNPGIYLPLAGGTMAGDIGMAGHKIEDLPDPLAAQEADTLIARNAAIAAALYTEGARVYHDTTVSIPHSTGTFLAFNSERYDTDGIHDNVTNNSRLTCKTAGKYIITAHIWWAFDPSGHRELAIHLSGTGFIARVRDAASSNSDHSQICTTIYDLAVEDYIRAHVEQLSGGALNCLALANYVPTFMMQRIG